jgi:predicted nucleic acid-binding protein
VLDLTSRDFDEARRLLQRIDTLRAPDALHLAFVQQRGFQMATLDKGLAKSASSLSVHVAPI